MSATLKGFLENFVSSRRAPGISYAFFSRDRVISSYQCGFADMLNQHTVSELTTFNAYSVTKTFTALGILQLFEKAKLQLDEPAKRYLPAIPYPESISIRHLLTHTSGISNPIPLKWIHLNRDHENFDRDRFFKAVFNAHSKVTASPGKSFRYSNLNYILLGQIIEAVSGEKFESYITKGILDFIDTRGTEIGFHIDETRQAKGYQKRFSLMNAALGFFVSRSIFMDRAEGSWVPFKFILVNGTAYGGLVSTVNSLVSYAQELLKEDCRFISAASKQMLFTEHLTHDGHPTGMCLSWFKGELNGKEFFCHAGGGGGYYCEVRLYPSLARGSVVMLNRSGMRDERLLSKIDQLIDE